MLTRQSRCPRLDEPVSFGCVTLKDSCLCDSLIWWVWAGNLVELHCGLDVETELQKSLRLEGKSVFAQQQLHLR